MPKRWRAVQKIHNGSKSAQTNNYLLLNIIALIAQQDGYNLLPKTVAHESGQKVYVNST
jgi:hypothetical protein